MSVMVAVPTRGVCSPLVMEKIWRLADHLDTSVLLEVGHLGVGVNRRRICQRFLESDDEVLVMVDDDVAPPFHAVDLIDGLDEYDIVAAAVPMFNPAVHPRPTFMASRYVGDRLVPVPPSDELVECDAIGTACVAFRRQVIEDLHWAFREQLDDLGNVTSDDTAFCESARDQGFTIACDFRIICDHITTVSLGSIMLGYAGAHRRPPDELNG